MLVNPLLSHFALFPSQPPDSSWWWTSLLSAHTPHTCFHIPIHTHHVQDDQSHICGELTPQSPQLGTPHVQLGVCYWRGLSSSTAGLQGGPLHLEACILDGGRVQFNTRQSGWFCLKCNFFFLLALIILSPRKLCFQTINEEKVKFCDSSFRMRVHFPKAARKEGLQDEYEPRTSSALLLCPSYPTGLLPLVKASLVKATPQGRALSPGSAATARR